MARARVLPHNAAATIKQKLSSTQNIQGLLREPISQRKNTGGSLHPRAPARGSLFPKSRLQPDVPSHDSDAEGRHTIISCESNSDPGVS